MRSAKFAEISVKSYRERSFSPKDGAEFKSKATDEVPEANLQQ